VRYVDSKGLATLCGVYTRSKVQGGRVVVIDGRETGENF